MDDFNAIPPARAVGAGTTKPQRSAGRIGSAPPLSLSRRKLLGRAAGAAVTLVVSQTLVGCGSDALTTEADDGEDATGSTGAAGCVLTAALEGAWAGAAELPRERSRRWRWRFRQWR